MYSMQYLQIACFIYLFFIQEHWYTFRRLSYSWNDYSAMLQLNVLADLSVPNQFCDHIYTLNPS